MVDHFYTPVYNGYSDGNSRLRSLSGVTPTASLNASTERTRARANTNNDYTTDISVGVKAIIGIDLRVKFGITGKKN